MLECCRQVTKGVMIYIDNKYGFIQFITYYQRNHNFSYFSTKTSYVTGSILNWGVVRLSILHTLRLWDAASSFFVRIWINLAQISCKLIEQCFSYIIKELLNLYCEYWHELAVKCTSSSLRGYRRKKTHNSLGLDMIFIQLY